MSKGMKHCWPAAGQSPWPGAGPLPGFRERVYFWLSPPLMLFRELWVLLPKNKRTLWLKKQTKASRVATNNALFLGVRSDFHCELKYPPTQSQET